MEKIIKFALVSAIAGLSLSQPALSQELEAWRRVSGWDVLIDPSLGNGCLIQAEYQDGSLVRIGFDRNEAAAYVTSLNENWGDIEEGATYPIIFDLDGQEYEGEATGLYINGVPGADVYFTEADFLFDLAKKQTLTLFNEQGEVMAIDLTGSHAGLEAAIECQEELG